MEQLTPAQMDAILEEHYRYEAEDDVEGVVSTLTPDCEHDVVGFPTGPVRGRDAARHFYEHLFAQVSGEKVTPRRRLYGPNFLVDEVMWEGKAIGRPFGFEGKNRTFSHRLLHVLEFESGLKQPLISRENVWLDFGAIVRQLGGGEAGR